VRLSVDATLKANVLVACACIVFIGAILIATF
jgi:hypothetical protein